MDSSWLIVVSLFGTAMAPLWAKWWNFAFRKLGMSPYLRLFGVLFFCLLTMLVVGVAPWILLSVLSGTLDTNLADPMVRRVGIVVFGVMLFYQAAYALGVAWPRDSVRA